MKTREFQVRAVGFRFRCVLLGGDGTRTRAQCSLHRFGSLHTRILHCRDQNPALDLEEHAGAGSTRPKGNLGIRRVPFLV